MASLFTTPPKPKTPKPATAGDPEAQALAAKKRRQLAGGGRSGTILTGPSGVASPAPVAAKTLLGQ